MLWLSRTTRLRAASSSAAAAHQGLGGAPSGKLTRSSCHAHAQQHLQHLGFISSSCSSSSSSSSSSRSAADATRGVVAAAAEAGNGRGSSSRSSGGGASTSGRSGAEGPGLAYEVLQGNLCRFTEHSTNQAPTAVLLHGILGRSNNMKTFAKMLVESHPGWQVVMVDLRCHGMSAHASGNLAAPPGPHTVEASAGDVLRLLRHLRLFPHMLIGHSFGGKVVMSMVRQFGARLPRPLQVWALDVLPGDVRAGEADGKDHPKNVIQALLDMPQPLPSRHAVMEGLLRSGFSKPIAQWAATNVRPAPPGAPLPAPPSSANAEQRWWFSFDIDCIADMYRSYEQCSMWPLLEAPPTGLRLDFVKAEGSVFRWSGPEEGRIADLGHAVHLLPRASHWVHSDNPSGLLDIMGPTFSGQAAGAGSGGGRGLARTPQMA